MECVVLVQALPLDIIIVIICVVASVVIVALVVLGVLVCCKCVSPRCYSLPCLHWDDALPMPVRAGGVRLSTARRTYLLAPSLAPTHSLARSLTR